METVGVRFTRLVGQTESPSPEPLPTIFFHLPCPRERTRKVDASELIWVNLSKSSCVNRADAKGGLGKPPQFFGEAAGNYLSAVALQAGELTSVPVAPWPDMSVVLVPVPSPKRYWRTRPESVVQSDGFGTPPLRIVGQFAIGA
jgi:hypothetical protein